MGLMTKGPVVVGVIAGTTAALVVMDVGRGVFRVSAWGRALGHWKWTRPYLAFIVLPALVLPWAILVHSRSAGFLDDTVWTGMIRPIFVKPSKTAPRCTAFICF